MSMLKGKVAIVTGGSSGIGRATTCAFAAAGAKVALSSDLNLQGGAETVRMITDAGGDAFFIKCDVSKEEEVKDMVAETIKRYGRLDCAFNNAGMGVPESLIADQPSEHWDQIMQCHLYGVFYCMKYEIPHMIKSGGGSIVNTSSLAGLKGYPGLSSYCAAKWGINGLTMTGALEYAKQGIRVNSVCPGWIETPGVIHFAEMFPELAKKVIDGIPLGHGGKPEEVADTVVWLCSDSASYITGVNLAIDGGIKAS